MKNYFALIASLLFAVAYVAHADSSVEGNISNTATVSFKDSNSTTRTVSSNTVNASAYRVTGVAMLAGVSKNVVRGTRVAFLHGVTNTGDSHDTFELSETNSGAFSVDGVGFYACADSGGHPDYAKPITSAVDVAPGTTICFVTVASVPLTATAGSTNTMVITATSARTGIVKASSTNRIMIGPSVVSLVPAGTQSTIGK